MEPEHLILAVPALTATLALWRLQALLLVRALAERSQLEVAATEAVAGWSKAAVGAVEQAMVKWHKANGTWDPAAASHAQMTAINLVTYQAGGEDELRRRLRCSANAAKKIVQTHIERAVCDLPRIDVTPGAPVPRTPTAADSDVRQAEDS